MIAIPKLLLLRTVLFFLVWALPLIFNTKSMVALIDKRMKNFELGFLFGLIFLIIGFFYLLVYAALDGTRYMMFSILGYLYLLKGIGVICLPSFTAAKSKIFYGKAPTAKIMGLILFVVSLFVLRVALVKF